MKILILSDIHGDYDSFNKVINNESFDKLIVLGDLFSYSYNSKEEAIIKLLQKLKNKLILIRGNCDVLIDYKKYGLQAHDIITIPLNNNLVTLTHGNRYCKGFLPEYHGNIFMNGHTHIPVLIKENDIIYCNPGSIGKPRASSSKGYLIFEDNKLILKTINNEIIKELTI